MGKDHEASRDLSPSDSAVTSGQSHTPGPWRMFESHDAQPHEISALRWRVCYVPHYGYDERRYPQAHAVQSANARLIAAAPELLAALKALLPAGWGDDDTMDHMPGVKLARAAIAKATGEQP